jgi:hypothetical protein
VIAGGESLVSHAGAMLLVETARRSGLARQLSRCSGRGGCRARPIIRARRCSILDPGRIKIRTPHLSGGDVPP